MTIPNSIFHQCYQLLVGVIIALCLCLLSFVNVAFAAPLSFDLPAQPLSQSLKDYGRAIGTSIAVDSQLVAGKNAPAVKGKFEADQALNQLLEGSGLRGIKQGDNIVIERKPILPSAENLKKNPNALPDIELNLNEISVRAKRFKDIGPMPGLALTKEQIPGNIQSISAKEIKEAHSLSLSDLLNSKLQSVNVNDYQGNPFQMDVTYRGFTASPQLGSPQGLSVFFDGIRVNEPFGDVVNWDMIPMNALGSFDVFPGSNPIFGLNTLGGALSMKTKSGFTDEGVSAEVLNGSFGRKQLQASGGWNNGNIAAFGAVNLFMEDGWRKNSPSKVNQAFGKLEWQGEKLSLGLSSLAAVNKLVGNGTVPQELYREDPSAVFTSPDITRNKLLQFQLSGAFDVNDTVNITGMMYSRNSDRISKTGDIIDFENFNYEPSKRTLGSRRAAPGETIICALADSNKDGVPDVRILNDSDVGAYGSGNTSLAVLDTTGALLPPDVLQGIKDRLAIQPFIQDADASITAPSIVGTSQAAALFLIPGIGITYNDGGVIKHVFTEAPMNAATCATNANRKVDGLGILVAQPATDRDGANDSATQGQGTGVVAGTPTAIITNSNISQSSQGMAMQINFNLDQHKLMVGTAFDRAKAAYNATQRLALLDNNRNVFSDPAQIGEEYYYASHDATINDFNGKSLNKSLYASETWSPIQTLNFSASGRYNYSEVTNSLAPRVAERLLQGTLNRFTLGGAVVCSGNDLLNCPISLTSPIEAGQDKIYTAAKVGTLAAQTERFTYHKFNPAIGVTWQAKPNLNIYGNWNQGTRVPSVIELGCAYDDTLVPANGNPNPPLAPRSLVEGRGCSLPSALSGDPYLPQVVAKTIEVGARGKFRDFAEWNVSAYRTNVQDDIYLTSLSPELSFFQSIGATLRQGIEFGMAGEYGRSDFRVNYSLTDATFQSHFRAISPNNSSRSRSGQDINTIEVSPGNVMPGVPFNNVNFNWGYKVTPKFKVNASVVAHSDSFLRGNENNAHTPSQGAVVTKNSYAGTYTYQEPDNDYPGKAPGYAVLNMNARYDLGQGWAASILVNNVLDKTYYTAGRLGLNPFSPSTHGAIGPGGFNYNSNEWIPSQFISAGAPRGVWVSLSYDFAKDKKLAVTQALIPEPDRTLDQPNPMPSAEEVALIKRLDTMMALPVLKQMQAATQTARKEVALSVDQWRKALAENNAEAYLSSYAETYAPAGISHNQWAEKQKLQFVTEQTASIDISDIWIEPKDKSMVAVFNQALIRSNAGAGNDSQVYVRKILTFEQKQGQWVIVREHAMPSNKIAKFNKAGANSDQTQFGSIQAEASQPPPDANPAPSEANQRPSSKSSIKPRLKKAGLNLSNKTGLNEATPLNAVLAEVK